MGHESQIELWTPLERRSALLVSELTGFVAQQAMKTARRGNPNRWAHVSSSRAHGVVGQNTSCSFKGAANQDKFQPLGSFFLLTPFIEPIWPMDWCCCSGAAVDRKRGAARDAPHS